MNDTNDTALTVCTITATTFTSPDEDTEAYARAGLESGGSAIITAKIRWRGSAPRENHRR